MEGHGHPRGTGLRFLVWLPPTQGSFPASPLPKKKLKKQMGRTHTKFYWEGVFTEAGRREGVTWGGGDCGYKADDRLHNGPCTHPNSRTGGRAAGAQEDGLGKDSKGRSPWAGGLRGL